jgi:hypothetical protein
MLQIKEALFLNSTSFLNLQQPVLLCYVLLPMAAGFTSCCTKFIKFKFVLCMAQQDIQHCQIYFLLLPWAAE